MEREKGDKLMCKPGTSRSKKRGPPPPPNQKKKQPDASKGTNWSGRREVMNSMNS